MGSNNLSNQGGIEHYTENIRYYKSQFERAFTSLNAGLANNITYKIIDKMYDDSIIKINSIDTRSKIRDRIDKIN